MTNEGEYTPTQQRIVDLLSDGLPHSKNEIKVECLSNAELASCKNVHFHIGCVRRKLEVTNPDEAIICEYKKRQTCYRRVRLLNGAKAK